MAAVGCSVVGVTNNANYGRTGNKHPLYGKRGKESAHFIDGETMHCGRWNVWIENGIVIIITQQLVSERTIRCTDLKVIQPI